MYGSIKMWIRSNALCAEVPVVVEYNLKIRVSCTYVMYSTFKPNEKSR